MAYGIVIRYHTGDSFNSYDEQKYIDYTWESLEVAEENLGRIQAHYMMTHSLYGLHHSISFKEMREKFGNEKWFVESEDIRIREFVAENSVMLRLDDGREVPYSCFWTGYFDQLQGAYIEQIPLPSFEV